MLLFQTLTNVLRTVISVVHWPLVTMYLTVTTVPAIQATQVMDSTVQVMMMIMVSVLRRCVISQMISDHRLTATPIVNRSLQLNTIIYSYIQRFTV